MQMRNIAFRDMRLPRLGAMRSGGFSPALLFAGGAEGAWYDPSDLSTLFQDSAGTTPVTASGQPVGLMFDKSGNGNHATQATAAKRPIYTEGSGLAWLAFDGVDDAMVTAAIDFTGTNKMSVLAGVRKLSDAATGVMADLSADATDSDGTFAMYNSATSTVNGAGFFSQGTAIGVANATAGLVPPANAAITGLGDISGDSSIIRINGIQRANGPQDQGSGNYGNHVLNIGSRNQTSRFFNGNIYGIIIAGKMASTDEIAATEAYLAAKSGVTL